MSAAVERSNAAPGSCPKNPLATRCRWRLRSVSSSISRYSGLRVACARSTASSLLMVGGGGGGGGAFGGRGLRADDTTAPTSGGMINSMLHPHLPRQTKVVDVVGFSVSVVPIFVHTFFLQPKSLASRAFSEFQRLLVCSPDPHANLPQA